MKCTGEQPSTDEAADRERRVVGRMRQLLIEGFRARTALEAALVVARLVCEHLGADRGVVLYFDDADRVRVSAATVGAEPEVDRVVRRLAEEAGAAGVRSAGWSHAATSDEVLTVEDAGSAPGVLRPGGIGQTLGLVSWLGIPLLVDEEPVGRINCGFGVPHRWTPAERNFAARVSLVASVVMEAARLRDAERTSRQALEYRAAHDPLTGLLNRGELERRLAAALQRRRGSDRLAVLLLDLDGFKDVNDTLGHAAGDQLLAAAAARIRSCVREGDMAGRLGGDEFAVVLTAATGAEAEMTAARIGGALAEPFQVAGAHGPAPTQVTGIGVSIGIALASAHTPTASATYGEEETFQAEGAMLLARADGAMYRVKRSRSTASAPGGARPSEPGELDSPVAARAAHQGEGGRAVPTGPGAEGPCCGRCGCCCGESVRAWLRSRARTSCRWLGRGTSLN